MQRCKTRHNVDDAVYDAPVQKLWAFTMYDTIHTRLCFPFLRVEALAPNKRWRLDIHLWKHTRSHANVFAYNARHWRACRAQTAGRHERHDSCCKA